MIAAREVWVGGAERLAAKGIESARLDARVLLAHAMNIEMVELLSARPPSSDEIARYGELLERRAAHEPVAYIVGEREFWSLRFEVGPGVLVPRPETETLLEETLRRFPERERSFDFLDFGTGSGCLLISGLRSYPRARGTGIDRSPAALDWARRNARLLGVDARCTWREGDWSSADGTFDIILAHPPYVRATEELPPDIARYEPHEALFAGADGLDAYRALAPIIARALKPEGRAFLEIGAGQGDHVRALLEAAGLEILATVPDLSGVPRCVIAGRAFG